MAQTVVYIEPGGEMIQQDAVDGDELSVALAHACANGATTGFFV